MNLLELFGLLFLLPFITAGFWLAISLLTGLFGLVGLALTGRRED